MSSPYPSDPRSVELQALQGQLTTRVQAVEKDLARALSEHDRQIHRERLDELCADRQTLVDYLDAIEREQPLPGPWPIELRTSDLAVRAAVFTFGKRPVFHVPDALPPNYVPRPELLAEVRQALLADTDTLALTSAIRMDALHGMGGIGKSVMVRALCDDPAVQAAFPDGILWTTLGQTPELIPRLREWIDALGGTVSEIAPTVDRLKAILADLLRERACLLVVDDAWRKGHAEAFRMGGPRCRLLLTTRDAALASDLGATVHAVPVMTEAEAVELLEEWAKGGLQGAVPELKVKIVQQLGRLPLAIKLAGAQLQLQEAGKWLASFDARKLKARRVEDVHDSLAATFGLSLDELAPAERRLYVALSIFREDEPLAVVGITRLWSALDGRDGDETRELRDDLVARALVERSQGDGEAIRIHNLLRDFMAVKLRDEGRIAAHRALLAAYRATQGGDGWHTAPNDGYLYDHLAYHLDQLVGEESETEAELHALFANPLWLYARVAQSGYLYDGYLADLDAAWRRKHEAAQRQIDADEEPAHLADCVRYALIRSSINSLAGNYDPSLVARAVETGVWPAERALSIARLIPDARRRTKIFVALLETKSLTSEQHLAVEREGLAAAQAIRDEGPRADVLAALAPLLTGDLVREGLAAAQGIRDERPRAYVLAALAPLLTGDLVREGLAAARAIRVEGPRADVLTALAPLLTGDLLREGMAAAQAIRYHRARTPALVALIPQLVKNEREQVLTKELAALSQVGEDNTRAEALFVLLPYLTGRERQRAFDQGLAAALVTIANGNVEARFEVLRALAPQLTRELLDQKLVHSPAKSRSESSQQILSYPLPPLTDSSHEQGPVEESNTALIIDWESYWMETLDSLMPQLVAQAREEVLQAALAVGWEGYWAKAVATTEPHLIAAAPEQVLATVLAIRDGRLRAETSAMLAQKLTGDASDQVLQQGLAAALAIDDEMSRVEALAMLMPQLTGKARHQALQQGLATALSIDNKASQVEALAVLVPQLTGEAHHQVLRQGLAAALAIDNERSRVESLATLAPKLTGDLLHGLLKTALTIKDEWSQVKALLALGIRLTGTMRQQVLEKALAAAHVIDERGLRAVALGKLALSLTGKLREEIEAAAMACALAIDGPYPRAQTLAVLAPLMMMKETRERAIEHGLAIAVTMDSNPLFEWAKAELLADLAPRLTGELMEQGLFAALAISDERYRVKTLVALAPQLVGEPLSLGLAATLSIGNERLRGEALAALTPQLTGELLVQGLAAALLIGDEQARAETLAAFGLRATGKARKMAQQEGLAAAQAVGDAWTRAKALVALVPQLTGKARDVALREGLAAAHMISYNKARAEVLGAFAQQLLGEDQELVLREALAIADTVFEEKDRVKLLAVLAPLLTEDLMQKGLAAVQAISEERYRAEALAALAPQLTGELMQEGLTAAQVISGERYRAGALAALLPFVENPSVCLRVIRQAIADHLRKWLPDQEREVVLMFCDDQKLFTAPILAPITLAAIAHHIIEICQEWEWL